MLCKARTPPLNFKKVQNQMFNFANPLGYPGMCQNKGPKQQFLLWFNVESGKNGLKKQTHAQQLPLARRSVAAAHREAHGLNAGVVPRAH